MSSLKNKKVIVGMSGGVDSLVAVLLLKKQGYQVEAVFMRFGVIGDKESEKNARTMSEKLGIKFSCLNVEKEFKKIVIDYFLDEYNLGRTPNPCIECNRNIKFGFLIKKAIETGADFIATGHYVRLQKEIKNKITRFKLLKSKDKNKDQSYFLYTLNQEKLKYCLFPIGDYEKSVVRILAEKNGFKIANKKESQEICFIENKYYGDFLKEHLELVSGDIVDENNNILGKHKGLPLYTIGQRRDIGIGGTGPYYVLKIDRRKNKLIVSNKKENKNLYSKKIIVNKLNWISRETPCFPFKIKAKVRYRMESEFAIISKEKEKVEVCFLKPQRAIMPGQSIVFYKNSEVLGGGIIKKVID